MIYGLVGLGGIIGSLLRYFIGSYMSQVWRDGFPAGTLLINLTGSFFLGWIISKFSTSKRLPPHLITALTTGVIGSYTTFSSFCMESVELIRSDQFLPAFMYILISLFGGFFCVKWGKTAGAGKAGKTL